MAGNLFLPNFKYIIGISNAQYAVVTFSNTHEYVTNEIISFRVTKPYGMVEINEKRAKVLFFDDTTVTIDIDTTFYTPFIFPVSGINTPPVCVPVGSGVNYDPSFSYTILNDAFDNVRV